MRGCKVSLHKILLTSSSGTGDYPGFEQNRLPGTHNSRKRERVARGMTVMAFKLVI